MRDMAEMRVRPWNRGIAWLMLAVLAADFLIPKPWVVDLHLAGHLQQMALCGLTALCVIHAYGMRAPHSEYEVFGSHIQWREPVVTLPHLLGLTTVVGFYAALLEMAQLVTADRHAAGIDFLINFASVAATSIFVWLAARASSGLPWRVVR